MSESIYIIDPKNKKPVRIKPISFGEIGIRERADLEEWVIANPEMFGEPLLVITSEFSRFQGSSRRLDVLALDMQGVLTIIELKLDVAGSLADQQAIRYAAFCSSMTMAEVVELYAKFHGVNGEDAEKSILAFLSPEQQLDELPELDDRPRIILAAGSMDDQELTSCVLWLRKFGVDITCVEITPYRMPESDHILLNPRIIIPLPEAKEYLVRTEQKEVAKVIRQRDEQGTENLWGRLRAAFEQHNPAFPASRVKKGRYMKVLINNSEIHYEWNLRKREARLDVAIHFESDDRDTNLRRLAEVAKHESRIREGIDLEYSSASWGKYWAQLMFRVPYTGLSPDETVIDTAATMMIKLIERTYPVLKSM